MNCLAFFSMSHRASLSHLQTRPWVPLRQSLQNLLSPPELPLGLSWGGVFFDFSSYKHVPLHFVSLINLSKFLCCVCPFSFFALLSWDLCSFVFLYFNFNDIMGLMSGYISIWSIIWNQKPNILSFKTCLGKWFSKNMPLIQCRVYEELGRFALVI